MAIVVTIYTLLLFVNKRQAAETKPTIKHFSKDIFNQVVSVILIMIIGYFAIIYPLYLYTTWNYPMEKQVLDATALLNTFRVRELVNLDIWMSGNKLLRPFGQYLLGVMMVTQRTAGGNNAYFLGELSSQGWWYYFPLVYLMKETLPALILIFSGCLISLFNIFKTLKGGLRNTSYKLLEYLNTYFTEFALFIFIAIYWSSSISSPLNIGARHIIPTIPMFYILSTGAIKRWFAIKLYTIPTTPWERYENFIHNIFNIWIKSFVLTILIIWLIVGTFITYPYFLSYFNEFSGGKYNGHQYITDSNFDWGQDLKRLKKWTDIHLESDEKIAIDYFGGGSPKYYLGYQAEPWWSSRGNPLDEGIEWLAVSVNSIQGAALATPVNGFYRNPADEYRWLQNPANPTDRAGTSIFLYRLSESTINIPKEDSSEKNLN
ncbi:hypothetical protein GW950_01725 [Candidatus Wolfebacteria bacterium]|nr:hypothetical protein [Candidatus Wolfebacteria bacterium]